MLIKIYNHYQYYKSSQIIADHLATYSHRTRATATLTPRAVNIQCVSEQSQDKTRYSR